MEDTHWVQFAHDVRGYGDGLNPCCNGRYSLSWNPNEQFVQKQFPVLILVVMEDTHWDNTKILYSLLEELVLILVVMEDTHWVVIGVKHSLN